MSSFHTLQRFGGITITGPDARAYLQGQLSLDMSTLTPARMELASCNSPQGRVQAVPWIVERSDGFALIVPAQLRDSLTARLRKYVLRARVSIEAASWIVAGSAQFNAASSERSHTATAAESLICWPGAPRTLALLPATATSDRDPEFERWWHLEDIRAGLPQVYPATSEAFVAQMLNIDLLGGIGFEKGCYTGQEIIARAHFRGTVKRRMFRFAANCAPPAPGTRVVTGETHAGDVVDAAATPDGCELLAVISLAQLSAALRLDGTDSALHRLPLPYRVTTDE